WVGVDVTGVDPSTYDAGTDPDAATDAGTDADADAGTTAPYEPRYSDSVEIYVSAKPDERDGDGFKTPWERQYIIDYLGRALQYVGSTNVPETFNHAKGVAKVNGYTIEMRISSDVFLPFTLG